MKIEPQDSINRVFPVEPPPAPASRSQQDGDVRPVANTAQPELQAQAKQARRGMARKSHRVSARAFEGEMEDLIDPTPRDSHDPWSRPK